MAQLLHKRETDQIDTDIKFPLERKQKEVHDECKKHQKNGKKKKKQK